MLREPSGTSDSEGAGVVTSDHTDIVNRVQAVGDTVVENGNAEALVAEPPDAASTAAAEGYAGAVAGEVFNEGVGGLLFEDRPDSGN